MKAINHPNNYLSVSNLSRLLHEGGWARGWSHPVAGYALTDVAPSPQAIGSINSLWHGEKMSQVKATTTSSTLICRKICHLLWCLGKHPFFNSSEALLLAPLFSHCKSCWLAALWCDSLACYTQQYRRGVRKYLGGIFRSSHGKGHFSLLFPECSNPHLILMEHRVKLRACK